MSQSLILPADWDDFTVPERFAFRKRTLGQFLVGWVSALALVKGGVVSSITNYQDQVLQDLPLGFWRMDETVPTTPQADVSGHVSGPHTLNPTAPLVEPTLAQPGLLNTDVPNLAADFNGTTQGYTTVSAGNWLPNMLQPASVECWFTTTQVTQGYIVQIASPSTSGNDRLTLAAILLASGAVAAQHGLSAKPSTPTTFADGNVHHVVATTPGGDPADAHVYADGVDYGVNAFFLGVGNQVVQELHVGFDRGLPASEQFWFDGVVDEVAVYDFELSAAQVLQHWNAGKFGVFT